MCSPRVGLRRTDAGGCTPTPALTTIEKGVSTMADATDARALVPALPRTTALATLDDALSEADIAATLAYAEQSHAQTTRAAYAADWKSFATWCTERGAT